MTSAKWHYEDRLITTKYNGSNMRRGDARSIGIGLPRPSTWIDFLEPKNENKRLDHKKEVSRTNNVSRDRISRAKRITTSRESILRVISIPRQHGSQESTSRIKGETSFSEQHYLRLGPWICTMKDLLADDKRHRMKSSE